MFDFTITPDGEEPYSLTATSRDILAWEKAGRNRSFSTLLRDQTFTDLYSLAHIAARRQGLHTGTLQDFEDSCDLRGGRDDVEDEGEPDPTRAAPGADSSSPSRSAPASPRPSGPRKENGRS